MTPVSSDELIENEVIYDILLDAVKGILIFRMRKSMKLSLIAYFDSKSLKRYDWKHWNKI